MKDLTDYYSTVGYLRATGMEEGQAYCRAEEAMEESALTTLPETVVELAATRRTL